MCAPSCSIPSGATTRRSAEGTVMGRLTEGTAVRDGSDRLRPAAERETTAAARVSGALAHGEAEIELRGVCMRYRSRDRETLALADIDLGIRKREFVTLVGQSG
jgi:ABC-type glutathione transport system ATPase component